MAKAEQHTEVVITTKTIHLELSEAEVNTLLVVLARISGSMVNSPRKHTEIISKALREATGIYYRNTPEVDLIDDTHIRSGIRFREYSENL